MTKYKSTRATLSIAVWRCEPKNRQFHWNLFGSGSRAREIAPGEVFSAGPIPSLPPHTEGCGARPGIGCLRERGGGFAPFIKARSLHHPMPEQI